MRRLRVGGGQVVRRWAARGDTGSARHKPSKLFRGQLSVLTASGGLRTAYSKASQACFAINQANRDAHRSPGAAPCRRRGRLRGVRVARPDPEGAIAAIAGPALSRCSARQRRSSEPESGTGGLCRQVHAQIATSKPNNAINRCLQFRITGRHFWPGPAFRHTPWPEHSRRKWLLGALPNRPFL